MTQLAQFLDRPFTRGQFNEDGAMNEEANLLEGHELKAFLTHGVRSTSDLAEYLWGSIRCLIKNRLLKSRFVEWGSYGAMPPSYGIENIAPDSLERLG